MANPLFVDEGLQHLLLLIRDNGLASYKLGLYTNNKTPAGADTITDYDEPTWSGYIRAGSLTWSTPDLGSGVSQTSPGAVHWAVESDPGSEQVFGWLIIDEENGLLIFAEKLTTPITPVEDVDVVITPTIRFRNP